MPRYDYECRECGKKWEAFHSINDRRDERCCGKEASLVIGASVVQVFKPMWYADICETPIYVESKRQLKNECKKHGVIAARLL